MIYYTFENEDEEGFDNDTDTTTMIEAQLLYNKYISVDFPTRQQLQNLLYNAKWSELIINIII